MIEHCDTNYKCGFYDQLSEGQLCANQPQFSSLLVDMSQTCSLQNPDINN